MRHSSCCAACLVPSLLRFVQSVKSTISDTDIQTAVVHNCSRRESADSRAGQSWPLGPDISTGIVNITSEAIAPFSVMPPITYILSFQAAATTARRLKGGLHFSTLVCRHQIEHCQRVHPFLTCRSPHRPATGDDQLAANHNDIM